MATKRKSVNSAKSKSSSVKMKKYNGVYKRVYASGTVKYRTRVGFDGKEYGSHFDSAIEAAKAYNSLVVSFYGKREAKSLGLLNEI